MTNLFLHRRDPLSGLEPAFAVAVKTIDPALAGRRRLAGPRQALLFRGSGRSGLRGSRVEEVGKRIRRRRRSRESREKEKSGETKSQMTGHENPGVAPPPALPLAAKWVTMRLKSGKAVDSFWPGNEIGARCFTRRESKTSTALTFDHRAGAKQNLRTSSSRRYSEYADRYQKSSSAAGVHRSP